MALCDRRYTAFQYAALSSVTSVLGRIVSGWSGVIQEGVGWPWFFAGSALATIPALIILFFLPTEIGALAANSVTIEGSDDPQETLSTSDVKSLAELARDRDVRRR